MSEIEQIEYGDDKIRCKTTTMLDDDGIAHLFFEVTVDFKQISNESELNAVWAKALEVLKNERN